MNSDLTRKSQESHLKVTGQILRYQPGILPYLEELLMAIASHLPQVLALRLIESPTIEPLAVPLEGTAMFADIDGFTPLAERFSQAASEEGAEELTELVNRFLEILISTTVHYGGDIQKFGGDAGTLIFTGDDHARRAVAASLDVQQRMGEEMSQVETSLGTFPLRISIGLGGGQMLGLGLGNHEGHEWLLMGAPLRSMGRAQSAAPSEGVVMDAFVRACCGEELVTVPLERDLHLLQALHTSPPPLEVTPLPGPPQILEDQRLLWLFSRLDALSPYLAPGLLERILSATALDQTRQWSEHRQVTIMMLSLSGVPDLSVYWQHPDTLRHVMEEPNTTFIRSRDVIQRYDGIVNKIGVAPQGPYLMALFGAPKAHEDDPLRAVLAGLELQQQSEVPLRIGVNTGFVFAGDVGTLQRREYTVMGDEVNLAYRLMAGCQPRQIWLGPNTARHPSIVRRVEGESATPQKFKGKRDLIAPFVAHRVRRVFFGAEVDELPLLGREKEMQQLRTALEALREGESRVVTVCGPAGIGKSRLLHEIVREAQNAGMATHSGAAPSYGSHLPYAVWERALRSLLQFEGRTPREMQEEFQERVDAYDLTYWSPLLAPLLGLDVPPTPEIVALEPELREDQRRTVLRDLWVQAARTQPLLLILENAQ